MKRRLTLAIGCLACVRNTVLPAGPKGRRTLAGGNAPGSRGAGHVPRQRHREPRKSKQVFFLVIDPVLLEKRDILLLEGSRAVVLPLSAHVGDHIVEYGDTDAKNGVSILPAERAVADGVVNPFGAFALDLADDFGGRVDGLEAHDDVDVIVHAADGEGFCAELAEAAAEVGMEAFLPFGEDERFAVFRGEDEVGVERGVGGTHDAGFIRSSVWASTVSGTARAAHRALREPGALPPASVRRPFGPGMHAASEMRPQEVSEMQLQAASKLQIQTASRLLADAFSGTQPDSANPSNEVYPFSRN